MMMAAKNYADRSLRAFSAQFRAISSQVSIAVQQVTR